MKRVLLALIPVALLATASLALTGLGEPFLTAQAPSEEAVKSAQTAPPPATTTTEQVTTKPQAPQPEKKAVQDEQVAQATEEPEEPLPTLVVDKSALNQAMADLETAIKQAKLAVTALDADSQGRYVQETVNYLAGSADSNFRLLAGTADGYKGVRQLLIQARVDREAAETQWIAAVQRQVEAKAKRVAELAQAGNGSAAQPPAPATDLSASLGPNGVLGTRGMRPEEQANDLVSRAIKHATEALRKASMRQQPSISDGDVASNHASDEVAQVMESIVTTLENAKKIIQIAIDR